jgi:uncharacterized repeat protein (TIGR03803 family)
MIFNEKDLQHMSNWQDDRGRAVKLGVACLGTVLSAVAVAPAIAATETVVYSFVGGAVDGAGPNGLINVDGMLYGTTTQGGSSEACKGSGCGTVYSVTTAGAERVVFAFQGDKDGPYPRGADPAGVLLDAGGTLYGTTAYGGAGTACKRLGCGTVFKVRPAGAEAVLYSFIGPRNAAIPTTGVIDVGRTFYGTTYYGGAHGGGAVFSVTAAGVEKVVYSFGGVTDDGVDPDTGLVNVSGTLYGTTDYGGAYGCGTVFAVTPTAYVGRVYDFRCGRNGSRPNSLINVDGTLYGTTAAGGGPGNGCKSVGCGTVFSLTGTAQKVLYSFVAHTDGTGPSKLINAGGTFYGLTAGRYGHVFSMVLSEIQKVKILYSFEGGTLDGAGPNSLIDVDGTLYGTTSSGGTNDYGTVFSLTP